MLTELIAKAANSLRIAVEPSAHNQLKGNTMTKQEIDAWADREFTKFERKERRKRARQNRKLASNSKGYRDAWHRGREAAEEAVSDRIGNHM